MTMDVILDVDTGIDDALALLYVAASPAFRIRAVTCVAGNAGLDAVVANTRGVLDLVGLHDIPVVPGAHGPLMGEATPASWVHGTNGIGDVDLGELGVAPRPASPGHAIETLRQVAEECDDLTVIALGPMTNLALALRVYPHLATRIGRVAVMGGAFELGNATATAEFNIWHDPEAAHVCLTSGIPHLLYGLEVFYRPRTTREDMARLRAAPHASGPLAATLLERLGAVYQYEPRVAAGDYLSCLGDAGLVVALAHPELMRTGTFPVNVSLHDPLTRGQTVVDRRYSPDKPDFLPIQHRGPLAEVGLDIDGDAVVVAFVAALSG